MAVRIGVERDGRVNHHLNNPILFRSDAKSNVVGRTEVDAVHRRKPGVVLCDIVCLVFVFLVPTCAFPTCFGVTIVLSCNGNALKQEFFFIFSVCVWWCCFDSIVVFFLKNFRACKAG